VALPIKRVVSSVALLVLTLTAIAFTAHAEPIGAGVPTNLDLPLGAARHIRIGVPIARVSSASKDVVDVAAFPPDDLLISAKTIGRTQVVVWTRSNDTISINVRVGPPADPIAERIHFLFPNAHVHVEPVGAAIAIAGDVPDANTAADIEKVAQAEITAINGDSKVINLLRVTGTPQVQLEVRFAEVSRTALRQIGFNFWTNTGGSNHDIAGGFLNPTTSPNNVAVNPGASSLGLSSGLSNISAPLSGAFSFLVASASNSVVPLSGALSLLSQKGFAKTLAEPTLVALSGQEASFLAGGEFPVPLPQALGQVLVQYKKFGIQLHFMPVVLGDETVQLKLDTIVSDIDTTLGISLAQVTVPGLVQRESSTTVRLRDGQTFAIAGLISDKMTSTVNKVPGLGSIPILGALFRSSSFQRQETELLVVITTHLVNPLAKGSHITVPGEDEVSDPNDFDFYLMGKGESHKAAPPLPPSGNSGYMR